MANKKAIQIYTDGSWTGTRGGYGYVMVLGKRMKKFKSDHHYVDTTNNRMEIRPVIEALERAKTGWKIDIYSDSTYVVNGMVYYIQNGDTRRLKVNGDLWQKLYDVIDKHMSGKSQITANWVRGHAGNTFNEMADKLAMEGAQGWDPKVCGRRADVHLSKQRK